MKRAGYHQAVAEFKRRFLRHSLDAHGGNRTVTARALGLRRFLPDPADSAVSWSQTLYKVGRNRDEGHGQQGRAEAPYDHSPRHQGGRAAQDHHGQGLAMSYDPNLHTEILELVGEVPTEVLVNKVRQAVLLGGEPIITLMARLAFNARCASQDLDTQPVEPADRKRFYAILDLIMALGGYEPESIRFVAGKNPG